MGSDSVESELKVAGTWRASRSSLAKGPNYELHFQRNESTLTQRDVLHLLANDAAFRSFFSGQLVDNVFSALRWETPAWMAASLDDPFRCVVVNSPGLAAHPDDGSFRSYFSSHAENDIAVFPNQGRDAILIVPCPIADRTNYGHLATFLRGAPEHQKHALWQRVGVEMSKRIGNRPVWLSTAGAGVSWLHVRIDASPKYYHHQPYRATPA